MLFCAFVKILHLPFQFYSIKSKHILMFIFKLHQHICFERNCCNARMLLISNKIKFAPCQYRGVGPHLIYVWFLSHEFIFSKLSPQTFVCLGIFLACKVKSSKKIKKKISAFQSSLWNDS